MAVVLGAVGSLVIVVSLHLANSSGGNSGVPAAVLRHQEARARGQAASWVTQQVNPDALVSCDQMMCNALKAAGFRGKLLTLGPTSPPPVTSAVVVVTQTVRDLFGSSIGSAWAPAVLASIGEGAAEVSIRVIAPHGIVSYQDQLKADLVGLQNDGKVLLNDNSRIKFSNTAQQQLVSGQVDPRLVLAVASLAGAEPIEILEFGNIGPGASTDMLLRYADLAVTDSAARLASTAYVQAMQTRLSGLDIQFRPARSQLVTPPGGGADVFRVEFTAPSPLTPIGGTP